jgi:hypothetical protein
MGVVKTVAVALVLLLASVGAQAKDLLYPLVGDWAQQFRIESRVSTRDGKSIVSGTVWNTTSWGAKRIQLLVDGLDANGTPVSQRVVWLGVDLGGGTHASFDVPMPTAASYRVSVFAFESGRGRWG